MIFLVLAWKKKNSLKIMAMEETFDEKLFGIFLTGSQIDKFFAHFHLEARRMKGGRTFVFLTELSYEFLVTNSFE